MKFQKSKIITEDLVKKNLFRVPILLGANCDGSLIVRDLVDCRNIILAGKNPYIEDSINSMLLGLTKSFKHNELRLIISNSSGNAFDWISKSPYLQFPINTKISSVSLNSDWLYAITYSREEKLEQAGCSHIEEYNALPNTKKMPYLIYLIYDSEIKPSPIMASGFSRYQSLFSRIKDYKKLAVGLYFIFGTNRMCLEDTLSPYLLYYFKTRISFGSTWTKPQLSVLHDANLDSNLKDDEIIIQTPIKTKTKNSENTHETLYARAIEIQDD